MRTLMDAVFATEAGVLLARQSFRLALDANGLGHIVLVTPIVRIGLCRPAQLRESWELPFRLMAPVAQRSECGQYEQGRHSATEPG